MPFVDSQGVGIHYEVEGQGPPLVLQHGFAGSIDNWRQPAYVDSLSSDYRLILIDARGHGDSGKPHQAEAYRIELTASDVTAVLDDLGVESTHYLGYSMGGDVGFGLAKHSPERLSSLIVVGSQPYGGDPPEAWIPILRQGARTWVETVVPPKYRPWFSPARMDPEAMIAWLSLREHAGLADGLSTSRVPTLLIVGEEDDARAGATRCAEEMADATLVVIPGADHLESIARTDRVLPRVKAFLAKVQATRAGD